MTKESMHNLPETQPKSPDKQNDSTQEIPPIALASTAEVLSTFHVDPDIGLQPGQIENLRKTYGFNEVAEQKQSLLRLFLRKFWGLSAWMLEMILVLSAVLGKYADLVMVSFLLVFNAVLSTFQQQRSTKAVDALREKLHINVRVLRDSNWSTIPARELVTGDIVRIRQGDIVPADIKLLSGSFIVDESILTGESREIEKHPEDILSAGSTIRHGEGNGIVILTGRRTFFGRITELMQNVKPKLQIEAIIAKVVKSLFIVVGFMIALTIVMMLIRSIPLIENIPLLLVLLMIAVPVALPVVLTASMAWGAKEMAKKGVLVTRLSATEDAATMDMICVDKTGTITENQLAVNSLLPMGQATETDLLIAAAMASDSADQDPIDLAFLALAGKRKVFDNLPQFNRVSFTPFDPQIRYTKAVVEQNGRQQCFMKGAVRAIAELCERPEDEIKEIETKANDSAQKGYRTLAVARCNTGECAELIGLATLHDPIRTDARQSIDRLREMGVSVKMLTGDSIEIAKEIASQVGLGEIKRVSDLKIGLQNEDNGITRIGGFAEIYPEDKYNIVQNLQADGHITGMTGDGVNDAPALRQAEVGIAVSTATDIAKSAASVVLTEPGLSSILDLIEEGRMIYQRILTWVINKISRTVLESAFVALPFILTGKFAISAFAMILLVFLRDFATVTIASDHVRPSKQPETWNIGGYVFTAAIIGLAMVAEGSILLYFGWTRLGMALNDNALNTFSFLTLLYFAALNLLSERERGRFWNTMPAKPLLISIIADIVIGTSLTLVGIPGLKPLPWQLVLLVFGYSAVCCLLINDALKATLLKSMVKRTRKPGKW